jgi:hypothetical protein
VMGRGRDGTTKDVGDFGESVENRGTKRKRRVGCIGWRRRSGQETIHVFGGLFEEIVASEGGEGNFGREEIGFEDVSFLEGFWNVDLPATIMFRGGANVPANNAVFTKGSAGVGRNMCNNTSAGGSNRCPVEVIIAEHGGMC